MPSPNPSYRAIRLLPEEALSPYAAAISQIQGWIEDAESDLNNSIDKLAYCPRTNVRAYNVCITELTDTRYRLRQLKLALFALREAEVYT